jgi:hypothetical protein
MGKYFDPQIPGVKRERVLGLSKKPLGGPLFNNSKITEEIRMRTWREACFTSYNPSILNGEMSNIC